MVEKKNLEEVEKKQLDEDELDKVSGGVGNGGADKEGGNIPPPHPPF